MKRLTGEFLNEFYGLGAKQARYRENGVWYHPLHEFPGVLFDKNGCVVFQTEAEYVDCTEIVKGPDPNHIHARQGISSISKYRVLTPPPVSVLGQNDETVGKRPAFLLARVGWMKYYRGPQQGDEKPIAGGKYTEKSLGHEAFNFKPIAGTLYGYFQPQMAASNIRLERIVPSLSNNASADGILVVFVATSPSEGGQRVIGWYRNAAIFREPQSSRFVERQQFDYFVQTSVDDGMLLPSHERNYVIPKGAGGIGQANIWYPYEGGKEKNASWIAPMLEFIYGYQGENLVQDPSAEADATISDVLESVLDTAAGFESNPAIRIAIEGYAMSRAKKYFKDLNFHVEDHSRTKPYDLYCTKGPATMYVEVKGTRSVGEEIQLTPNEVEHARLHGDRSVLFIVHSVEVTATKIPTVHGGEVRILDPFLLENGVLRPRGYIFGLPKAETSNKVHGKSTAVTC